MPDHVRPPPSDWRDAFAALPPEPPPPDGWAAIVARLDARAPARTAPRRRRRARGSLWAAGAAALALVIAIVLPRHPPAPRVPPPDAATAGTAASAAGNSLERLYAESAQLESLLAVARDDRVSSANAALLADAFDGQLAEIDAALAQSGLSPEDQLALWQRRVDGLRALAGFESHRRWLAAQGTRYDVVLIAAD